MMKFFSRELCERLQELGCKSDSSDQVWFYDQEAYKSHDSDWFLDYRHTVDDCYGDVPTIPVFSQNDFTGCHQQAKENAKLVWGATCPENPCPTGDDDRPHEWVWGNHRHAMIDATDAEEYLKETMREVEDE